MFFDFVCQIGRAHLHLHMYVIFVRFVFELTFY